MGAFTLVNVTAWIASSWVVRLRSETSQRSRAIQLVFMLECCTEQYFSQEYKFQFVDSVLATLALDTICKENLSTLFSYPNWYQRNIRDEKIIFTSDRII